MKTIFLVATSIFVLFALSCKTNVKPESTEVDKGTLTMNEQKDIPFDIAKNFFVKNTVADELLTLKISSQDDFDKYFGMATTMINKPSPIDFSKQYVLAIINKKGNETIDITPQSLIQKENDITLTYKISEGETQSFVSQTALVLIVSNEYTGDLKFVKQ